MSDWTPARTLLAVVVLTGAFSTGRPAAVLATDGAAVPRRAGFPAGFPAGPSRR
jgi:hypothetical protein